MMMETLLHAGAETLSPTSVEAFDFKHPPRLGRAKRAGLETIFGRFALSIQAYLSSRLRTLADVVVEGVEQGVFNEYVASLGAPCAAVVFELRTDRDYPCVLDFGGEFGFYLIDRLLGGSGVGSLVKRPMTPLEQTILRGLAENIVGRLADAWKDDLRFTTKPIGFESFPEVLGSICGDDNVLVARIHVDSFKFTGGLSMSIPIRALEAFLHEPISVPRLDAASAEEIAITQKHLIRCVRACELEVDVAMPPFTLRARDLRRLGVGDVIRTGHTTRRPSELLINGQRRFLGKVGVLGGYMSVQVEHALTADSPISSSKPQGAVL